jgi:predicted NUDIX family NTP pyrophosphohydrolase
VAGETRSAGLLLHRVAAAGPEVLIAHMGGPFWARKDEGAWSIPKGRFEDGEGALAVALREFEEEIGTPPPAGDPVALGDFRQPSGKTLTVFALRGDLDVTEIHSNLFEMEWPRGSGRLQSHPEMDRAEWVTPAVARAKVVKGQIPVIDAFVHEVLGAVP